MYATTLSFYELLDHFKSQSQYEYMLIFASSFDKEDKEIIRGILQNAKRIAMITGDRICFFYFMEDAPVSMNEKIYRWSRNMSDTMDVDEVISVNMETAYEICDALNLSMTEDLPSFLLISKTSTEIFRVKTYNDLEDFLSPLIIINSYKKDLETLRDADNDIREKKLSEINTIATEKLNFTLCSDEGGDIIKGLSTTDGYSSAILRVWNIVKEKENRISKVFERIHKDIKEQGYDVFISCKSQDYESAHKVYSFLQDAGHRPFLADMSIKEVGVDRYTDVIGVVLSMCKYMVVFATDERYLESPFVHAEWISFITALNSGRKPEGQLVTILSPNIKVNSIPYWLSERQCMTTKNYKDQLLSYLKR